MFKKGALAALFSYVAVSLAEGASRAIWGRENSLLEMIWHWAMRPMAAFLYAAGDLFVYVLRHIHLEEFFFSFWDTLCLLWRVAIMPYDFLAGMVGLSFLEYHIGDFIPGVGILAKLGISSKFLVLLFPFAIVVGYAAGVAVLRKFVEVAPPPEAPVVTAPEEPSPPPKRVRRTRASEINAS
jgi:hypothetical protein